MLGRTAPWETAHVPTTAWGSAAGPLPESPSPTGARKSYRCMGSQGLPNRSLPDRESRQPPPHVPPPRDVRPPAHTTWWEHRSPLRQVLGSREEGTKGSFPSWGHRPRGAGRPWTLVLEGWICTHIFVQCQGHRRLPKGPGWAS